MGQEDSFMPKRPLYTPKAEIDQSDTDLTYPNCSFCFDAL